MSPVLSETDEGWTRNIGDRGPYHYVTPETLAHGKAYCEVAMPAPGLRVLVLFDQRCMKCEAARQGLGPLKPLVTWIKQYNAFCHKEPGDRQWEIIGGQPGAAHPAGTKVQ